MRKLFTAVLILAAIITNLKVNACNDQTTLVALIRQLDSAATLPQYLELANAFERASQVEKQAWYPLYYASYCYTIATFKQKDKPTADQYADKALELAENAAKLAPGNSEISTLQGYACQAKLSVYPMERAMTMAGKANKYFEQAIKQDPENPRPYYLRSQNLYHTPAAMGGGKEKACEMAQKAAHLFEARNEEKLAPTWGKNGNTAFLQKCQP